MSYLDLDNLSKSFKDDKIISNLNAKIEKGEFFVVFGPSGSGKTVLLRLLSGIMMADSGEIKMDNQIINELHPEERDVSMAFQNFALYPHMKAYENIASPLRAKNKNMTENEIHEKVNEIANLLKIGHVLNQFPKELSNGQKQRTSLARSLVDKPSVVLLDDPLRNVDAKIRFEMRLELPKVLKEFNTTVIYITQDFREAMALGDRIAVLYDGKFNDIDSPKNIYQNPSSLTTAKLFGDPTINNFDATIKKQDGFVEVDVNGEIFNLKRNTKIQDGKCIVGIRPEDIVLSNDHSENSIEVEFRTKTPLNLRIVFLVRLKNGLELLCSTTEEESHLIDENKKMYISFIEEKSHFFDIETKRNLE
jgi:multiple sugar transport system ATP-binding protein